MCTTHIYTYSHPNGGQEQTAETILCPNSWAGATCINHSTIQHPPQLPPYMTQLPPTPQYSPSPSNYRSGDDSDRSFGSSSSKKRASGVYVNGQKVLDLNRRESHRRNDRRVVIDNNPTAPRTPPQSPSGNTYAIESPPRHSRSNRHPAVVFNDPGRGDRYEIEVIDNESKRSSRSRSHSRHTSTSSHSDEEEKRRRRREREKRREDELRDQKINARIVSANKEIGDRPAVPLVPILKKRPSSYKRPAVEVPYNTEAEIIDKFRRLELQEARRQEKAYYEEKAREEEAQRKRLEERMNPRRRSSASNHGRRRVVYNDGGLYRYE